MSSTAQATAFLELNIDGFQKGIDTAERQRQQQIQVQKDIKEIAKGILKNTTHGTKPHPML